MSQAGRRPGTAVGDERHVLKALWSRKYIQALRGGPWVCAVSALVLLNSFRITFANNVDTKYAPFFSVITILYKTYLLLILGVHYKSKFCPEIFFLSGLVQNKLKLYVFEMGFMKNQLKLTVPKKCGFRS